MSPHLEIHPEVRDALANKQPVVALESTVITHGLPFPQNLEIAVSLESEVRAAGAIPATVALVNGKMQVGLDHATLEQLAKGGVDKVSLWNLPSLVAQGVSGGTTVAATAHIARIAGIEVFSTGGLGGVHFDAFDESADLPALARTPVVVVSAGAKSILNLPATLERFETLGVPVVGYRTSSLPAFHSPDSPYSVPSRLETPEQIALAHRAARSLELSHAILVMNPTPEGIPFAKVQAWAEAANHEARRQGIHGKDLTPFLLARIAEISNGETVRINAILLRANAHLGGQIAVALSRLEK
jgi:pseudouridylate synthase